MCCPPFFTFSWALLPRQPGLCKALRDCSMIQLRYMSSHAALQTISWANDNYPWGRCNSNNLFSPYQADSSFPLVTSCQHVPLHSGRSPLQGIPLELFIDGNLDAHQRLGCKLSFWCLLCITVCYFLWMHLSLINGFILVKALIIQQFF